MFNNIHGCNYSESKETLPFLWGKAGGPQMLALYLRF